MFNRILDAATAIAIHCTPLQLVSGYHGTSSIGRTEKTVRTVSLLSVRKSVRNHVQTSPDKLQSNFPREVDLLSVHCRRNNCERLAVLLCFNLPRFACHDTPPVGTLYADRGFCAHTRGDSACSLPRGGKTQRTKYATRSGSPQRSQFSLSESFTSKPMPCVALYHHSRLQFFSLPIEDKSLRRKSPLCHSKRNHFPVGVWPT